MSLDTVHKIDTIMFVCTQVRIRKYACIHIRKFMHSYMSMNACIMDAEHEIRVRSALIFVLILTKT